MNALPLLKVSAEPRDRLFNAIRDTAILRSTEQRLVSPNGSDNSWLIDLRRIFMDGELLDMIAEMFWQEFADKMPFQVGGMEVAAIPLVTAIIMKSVERGTPINGFIVRKERKKYGTGSLIEGHVSDLPIVIVDDLIGSGGSMEKVRVVLEQLQKRISLVFVLIDYMRPEGVRWRQDRKIPVVSFFRLKDFGLDIDKTKRTVLKPIFHNAWCFASPDPNFYQLAPKSFPITDGKKIYFGSDVGFFWCIDASSGKEIWRFKVTSKGHKNIWSSPALHNGRVYFGGYDGNVYCLDTATGSPVWVFSGSEWVGSSPALATELGLLFVGLEFPIEGKKGSVIALDMETGERVWEHPTKRFTHASPIYLAERQLVACGSNDDEMFLFEARTGKVRWRFQTKGEGEKGSIRHAPDYDKKRGQIVTGCADGYIYVIDVDTGEEVWSVKTDGTIYSVPLVVDDLAFMGSTDKHMYILDLEKRVLKKKMYVASKIFSPPRLLEGKVYFGACNGLIFELDPVTAQITGKHQLPDAMTNAMIYSPETKLFYALTYVNQLYALTHL